MAATISDQLLADVLRQYPLSQARVVAALEVGSRNDSYLVEDVTGDRYILRCYRRNADERRIRFQLRFQQQLLERGFPTSVIVEPESQAPFVASEAGSWVLFTYVEGGEFDFTRVGQVAEAGRRLAEFHSVADTIEIDEVVGDANSTLRHWWTDGERLLAELGEQFAGLPAEEELAYVRRWWNDLLRDWPLSTFDALPAGWVHGDYHGRNMVFVGDEMRGLFDFDVVQRSCRISDIAGGLFTFGREHRRSYRIRPEAARLFWDAYASSRPIAGEEREALSMIAALSWAPIAPYYQMLEREDEDPVPNLRRHVNNMRAIAAEMERLAPLPTEPA